MLSVDQVELKSQIALNQIKHENCSCFSFCSMLSNFIREHTESRFTGNELSRV